MIKLFRCRVLMSQLRVNILNANGDATTVKKKDVFGTEYIETVEKTYRKGEELSLPEAYIKKLGKSVEIVMVPQVEEPMVVDEVVSTDGELRESKGEKTVADMIPKNDVKDKDKPSGRVPTSKGKK